MQGTDEPQETLVDRLIREAMESGEFDELPGAGQPIPGAGSQDDEYWWVREWLRRNWISASAKDESGPD